MKKEENYRLEQARRVLFILKLFKKKYRLSVQEIIGLLEDEYKDVSKRSIQRDLKILSDEELIVKVSSGRNTAWLLAKNQGSAIMPFKIKSSEMLSFYLLKSFLKSFRGTSIESDINSLEMKLEELAPDEVIQEESFIWDSNPGYYDYSDKNNTISAIVKSIVEKNIILFEYQSNTSSKYLQHEVFPQSLLFYNGSIYLIGYHLKRRKQLTYAIQNLHNISVSEKVHYNLPNFNKHEYEKNVFSIFETKDVKDVKIRISQDFEKYFENRQWHSSAIFTRDKSHNMILNLTIPINHDVVAWICGWREAVQVLEPQELKDEVIKSLKETLKQYL